MFSSEAALNNVATCRAPPLVKIAVLDGSARRQVLDQLAQLVAVHRHRGEEGGRHPDGHQTHLAGDREPPA